MLRSLSKYVTFLLFSAITASQAIQIKKLIDERINKHPKKEKTKRTLSDSSNLNKFYLIKYVNYFVLLIQK